jgi:ribosome recycling factor
MGNDSSTNFPPAGQPKQDPKQTLGKTMQELTDEAAKELDEKTKKSEGSIKYAKPGKSDILP